MNKDEVIKMMLDSINADNREICARAGMDEQTVEMQIEQSQPSLAFMLDNVYDKLKQANLLI